MTPTLVLSKSLICCSRDLRPVRRPPTLVLTIGTTLGFDRVMNFTKLYGMLAAALLLFTLGCSSWALKEKCEQTNWFEYSQKVAFQGKYLEEDGFIKDCKRVDRSSAVQLDLGFKQGREKMCQYDEIYGRAREGVPVFFKFCDGLDAGRMRSLYKEGLASFCTEGKGYSFGKSGKIYQNLCTPQQEKAFLPSYFKGRREYLTATIADLTAKLISQKNLEDSFADSERRLEQEYSTLPRAMQCDTRMVYIESLQQEESKLICEEASYVRSRRTELWTSLNSMRNRLTEVRSEWLETQKLLNLAKLD
ncbi:MAG: DUF2799 domain-containing protein, partial [Proteobacteria bacterium]